jgi:hypothetical protein
LHKRDGEQKSHYKQDGNPERPGRGLVRNFRYWVHKYRLTGIHLQAKEFFLRVFRKSSVTLDMKEKQFDQVIERVKALELPTCPGNLEANVLRRLRLSGENAADGFWAWASGLNLKSGVVVAALGMVLAVTSLLTVSSINNQTSRLERNIEANRALDLAVFKGTELINFDNPITYND